MDQEQTTSDVRATTPGGETGIGDHRDSLKHEGAGHVDDATRDRTNSAEGHRIPSQEENDTPSGDDPYGSPSVSSNATRTAASAGAPSYEEGQGDANQMTGGSSDPNNSLTHADSGDETAGNSTEGNPPQVGIDGFSDTKGGDVAIPDPGISRELEPLDPEAYAEALLEARTPDSE